MNQIGPLDKNALRKKYRPDPPVRFLLIGESPPRGENFFYLCQGAVFHHTQAVFKRTCFKESVPQGRDFLKWFQENGCYLGDLCADPTNGMKWGSPARKKAWREGVPGLSAEIIELLPVAAFVFVKGIIGYVRQSIATLEDDNLKRALTHSLGSGPMPESKGDPTGMTFEKEMGLWLLKNLQP